MPWGTPRVVRVRAPAAVPEADEPGASQDGRHLVLRGRALAHKANGLGDLSSCEQGGVVPALAQHTAPHRGHRWWGCAAGHRPGQGTGGKDKRERGKGEREWEGRARGERGKGGKGVGGNGKREKGEGGKGRRGEGQEGKGGRGKGRRGEGQGFTGCTCRRPGGSFLGQTFVCTAGRSAGRPCTLRAASHSASTPPGPPVSPQRQPGGSGQPGAEGEAWGKASHAGPASRFAPAMQAHWDSGYESAPHCLPILVHEPISTILTRSNFWYTSHSALQRRVPEERPRGGVPFESRMPGPRGSLVAPPGQAPPLPAEPTPTQLAGLGGNRAPVPLFPPPPRRPWC